MAIGNLLKTLGKIGLNLLSAVVKAGKFAVKVAKVVGPAAVNITKAAAKFAAEHPQFISHAVAFGAGAWSMNEFGKIAAENGIRTEQVESYYEYLKQLQQSGIDADTLQDMVDKIIEGKTSTPNNGKSKNHPKWWADSSTKVTVRDLSKIFQDVALEKVTHLSFRYNLVDAINKSNVTEILDPMIDEAVAGYYKRLGLTYTHQDVEDARRAYYMVVNASIQLYSIGRTLIRSQNEYATKVNKTSEIYYPILRGTPFTQMKADFTISSEATVSGTAGTHTVRGNAVIDATENSGVTAEVLYGYRAAYWSRISNAMWAEVMEKILTNAYLSNNLREYIEYLYDQHFLMSEPNAEPIICTFFPDIIYGDTHTESTVPTFDEIYNKIKSLVTDITTYVNTYRPVEALLRFSGFSTQTKEDIPKRDMSGKTYILSNGDIDLRYALANAVYLFTVPTTASFANVSGSVTNPHTIVMRNGISYPAFDLDMTPYSRKVLTPQLTKITYNSEYDPNPINAITDYEYGKFISLIKFRCPYRVNEIVTAASSPLQVSGALRIERRNGVVSFIYDIYPISVLATTQYSTATFPVASSVTDREEFAANLDWNRQLPSRDSNVVETLDSTHMLKLKGGWTRNSGPSSEPTVIAYTLDYILEARRYNTLAKVVSPVDYAIEDDNSISAEERYNADIRYHLGNAFAYSMFEANLYKDVAARWEAISSYYGIN